MVLNVHRVSGRGRSTGVVHTALNALSLVGAVKGPISCARHCSSTCSGCTFFIIMISELSSKGACGRSDPGFRQPRHDRRSLRLTGGGHGKFYYILLPGILAQYDCVPELNGDLNRAETGNLNEIMGNSGLNIAGRGGWVRKQ